MELELGDSEGLLDGDMALVCLMVDGSVIGGRERRGRKKGGERNEYGSVLQMMGVCIVGAAKATRQCDPSFIDSRRRCTLQHTTLRATYQYNRPHEQQQHGSFHNDHGCN